MCKEFGTICDRLIGPIEGSQGPTKGSQNLAKEKQPIKMLQNPFQEIYGKNFDIPEGRTIYLSRHGESEYNLEDRIGGDSNLTPRGEQYAKSLGLFMKTAGNFLLTYFKSESFLNYFYILEKYFEPITICLKLLFFIWFSDIPNLQVWTSSLIRTKQTAAHVNAPQQNFKEIDEINAGKFDGFTYDEVSKQYPEEFEARAKDKLGYRYPEGKK